MFRENYVNTWMAGSYKPSIQSMTTNVTLANDNDLLFNINPGEIWVAEFVLSVGSALATTGLKLALNAPSGCAIEFGAVLIPDIYTTTDAGYLRTTSIATALNFTTTLLGTDGDAMVKGMAYAANGVTAGVIQLQFAQSSSSGTAISLRSGSYMIAHRMR